MTLPQGDVGRPIAHRGLWRPGLRPENSLAAFEAACAANYGIELDVCLTADGEAVVFHDDALDRLTAESGLVEERTLDELRALTLLGGDHQRIPSLGEALQVIAGRTLVLIELKTPAGQEGPLEAMAAQFIDAYAGPVGVLSFNADSLACMARSQPGTPRGLNLNAPPTAEALNKAKPNFLSIDRSLADHADIRFWRGNGGKAVAWTVRDEAQAVALDGLIDNIMFEGFLP